MCTLSLIRPVRSTLPFCARSLHMYEAAPHTSAFACIQFLTLKCEIDRKITIALFRLTLIRYVFKTIYVNNVYSSLHMSLYTPSTH